MAGLVTRLRGKGKLVAATMSAITATTMAVVTFTSGAGGVDQLAAAAEDIRWNGPVGLLDADYQHLVIVGRIGKASTADEYVVGDVRDPMVAPTGALKVRTSPKPEGPAKPAPVTLPNMWLSGIIWDEQSPIAMIDGLDYRVGDRVKGARIVKIRIDSVVLSFASKEYVLTVD